VYREAAEHLKIRKGAVNMPHTALRFICDSMLGRLAKNLRMLGFDTLYDSGCNARNLVRTGAKQQRIISKPAASILFLHSNDPKDQLREVIAACSIDKAAVHPFSLCLRCNVKLAAITKEAAEGLVADYVYATVEQFAACPSCGRLYWKGTHYSDMAGRIPEMTGRENGPQRIKKCTGKRGPVRSYP
jgi:hypothetical protein